MRRPFGVTAIAVLQLAIGLYGLAVVVLFVIDAWTKLPSGAHTLLESRWAFWLGGPGGGTYVDLATSLVFLALSVGYIPIGIGMWLLRDWAWRATIILQGFYLVTGIYAFFRGKPVYLAWIGAIVIVLYLNQAEVKAAFTGHTAPPGARHG